MKDNLRIGALLELSRSEVGKFCDEILDADTFFKELDNSSNRFSRRDFCEFVDVAPSTLSGWLKKREMPRMAKVAYVLLRAFEILRHEIKRERREVQELQIVETESGYQICEFKPNEDGVRIGRAVASGIKSIDIARSLVSSTRSIRLLKETIEVLDWEIPQIDDWECNKWIRDIAVKVKELIYFVSNDASWLEDYEEPESIEEI